jgi:hypothetical protein
LLSDEKTNLEKNKYLPKTDKGLLIMKLFTKGDHKPDYFNNDTKIIASKAMGLVFQTLDPSFFLMPYVLQKQGVLASLFFFVELNIFAYLAGQALIEARTLY